MNSSMKAILSLNNQKLNQRNKVNVAVKNGLTCGLPAIHADIEAIDTYLAKTLELGLDSLQ